MKQRKWLGEVALSLYLYFWQCSSVVQFNKIEGFGISITTLHLKIAITFLPFWIPVSNIYFTLNNSIREQQLLSITRPSYDCRNNHIMVQVTYVSFYNAIWGLAVLLCLCHDLKTKLEQKKQVSNCNLYTVNSLFTFNNCCVQICFSITLNVMVRSHTIR